MDAAAGALNVAQANYNAYISANNQAIQMLSLDDAIKQGQDRLDSLYSQSTNCLNDCGSIIAEIKSVQQSIRNFNSTKQSIIRQNFEMANKVAQFKAAADAAQANLTYVTNRYAQIASGKTDLIQKFRELYKTYTVLEGGIATIEFGSDWQKQIQTLKELNPTKNFTAINTHDATVAMAVLGASATNLASQPALLDSVVNGVANTNSTIKVASYPEQFTANVRLSLTGACPIVYPNQFPSSPGIVNGKVQLGVSVNYQYDAAFETKIDCVYDEKEMYSKVLNSGNSGFLFWKRSWQSINIDDIKKTTFSCNWDGQTNLDFYKRRKFEIDSLNYAISRMLMKYGQPQDISVTQPAIPTSGLSEIGQGLEDLCGASSIYCKAGSWVMKSFDAIFGSGSSTGSGTVNTQSTQYLKWDENLLQAVNEQTNFNTNHP